MGRFGRISMLTALLMLGIYPWVGGAELKAGTAKAVITPEKAVGRILVFGSPAKGVQHDLYARALSLNDGSKRLIILTYDLNCLDVATPILRSRLKHELGIEPEYFLPMATHNHAAPIQIVPGNFDYGRWLADRMFALIQEAIANESGPVTLRFGYKNWDWSLASMDLKRVDDEVQVLQVKEGGRTVAVLFSQATHPLQTSTTRIGVGHPGYALEEIERKFPGALALYADGAGGTQFVLRGWFAGAPVPVVEKYGKDLAGVVEKILKGPMTESSGPITSRLEVIPLPLAAPMPYEEALKLVKDKKIPTDLGFVPYPEPDRNTNWVRALLQTYEQKIPFPTQTTDRECTDDAFLVVKLPEPREFPCVYEETITAKIGPLVIVSMQGEVCTQLGLAIKEKYRGQTPLLLLAYLGEHNLYIPTRDLVERKAYQGTVIQTQYASPVGWSPEVGDEMVKAVAKMINEIIK